MHDSNILPFNPKALAVAKIQKRNFSPVSYLLWRKIKNGQLGHRFIRLVPIADFVVDFYCPKLKLAIEIEDINTISSEKGHSIELFQHYRLGKLGIRFVKIHPNIVKTNMNGVLNHIRQAVKELDR